MKILAQGVIAAGLIALAACNNTPAEKAAENIEDTAENQADMLEEMADNTTNEAAEDSLENQADTTREVGDNRSDAVEEADDAGLANTSGM